MSALITAAVGSAVVGGIMAGDAADTQADAMNNATNSQAAIQSRQLKLSEDQWARYLETYAPLEDAYVKEAQNYGSIANQNKAAGQAAAANAAAYGTARERLARNPGMNQSEQTFLQEQNRINLAEAAGSATAQNTARDKIIDTGNARMTDAISLGKNLPAQAASSMNAAAQTGSGIMSAQVGAANQQYKSDMASANGIGQAVGGLFQSKTFQNWLNGGTNSMGNSTAAAAWETPATSWAFGTGGMGG